MVVEYRRGANSQDRGCAVTSVMDVIDEFLLVRPDVDFSVMSGSSIHELGARVRDFSASATIEVDRSRHPVYIGEWPSANFWLVNGDMILSSLLYSGQVLVRDPISDWFSDEQYQVEHLLPSRPGYLDSSEGFRVRVDRTRAFLNSVYPALQMMRPLIDAGLLVLVPAERSYFKNSRAIEGLREQLVRILAEDPLAYSERFAPEDIATEANVRGMFLFVPEEDPSAQIGKAVARGLQYFSREYQLATEHGATYTAVFDHELFLCDAGISRVAGPSSQVAHALLQSSLPIFSGLSAKTINAIHDDEAFAEFRADLHHLYQGAPLGGTAADLAAYVRDQEQVLLAPTLRKAEQMASRGILGRIGASLTKNVFGIATGLATDIVLQTGGLATVLSAAKTAADASFADRPKKGSQQIWTSLVRHSRKVDDQLSNVEVTAGSTDRGWGISREPSMSVTVSRGSILMDFMPQPPPVAGDKSESGVYRMCDCGSGRKFKFCCASLQNYQPTFLMRKRL